MMAGLRSFNVVAYYIRILNRNFRRARKETRTVSLPLPASRHRWKGGVDSRGVDVLMSQLLLKSIESPTAVEEVDGIPVAE